MPGRGLLRQSPEAICGQLRKRRDLWTSPPDRTDRTDGALLGDAARGEGQRAAGAFVALDLDLDGRDHQPVGDSIDPRPQS
jgi:hypothetical protein